MHLMNRALILFIFSSSFISSESLNSARQSIQTPQESSHSQPSHPVSYHPSEDVFISNQDELRSLERNKRKYDLNDQRSQDSNYEHDSNSRLQRADEAFCVMGNICGTGGGLAGDANIPCHYHRKPATLQNDTEALDVLRTICPSLFENTDNPAVCCSGEQVREMDQNFAQPRDLGMGKCPSCMRNFRTLHCEMTCSPRQSSFIQVINHELVDEKSVLASRTKANDKDGDDDDDEKIVEKRDTDKADDRDANKTEQYMILEINYFLDKDYVTGLFESCRNVKSVMGGQLIDVLCGAPPCSPTKWVKFMGTSYLKKGFAPIQVNYIPVENRYYSDLNKVRTLNNLDKLLTTSNLSNSTFIQPMNVKTFKCYERISNEIGACVCADCEQTCDILAQSALSDPGRQIMFSGQSFTIFLGWLLFVMVSIGVFTYFLLVAIRKRRTYSRKCYLQIF